ncbi:Adapter protein [Dirofilaria immitis]
MAPTSNRELIPIYTEWVNRHLIRYGREPINDLTNDLREPLKLAILLQAITFDCVPAAEERINAAINENIEPAEIIAACLQFVASLNIDISKVAIDDILNGHLGAILSLLYGLSTYKQQIKQSLRAAIVTNAVVQSSELSVNNSQIIQLKTKRSKDIGRISTTFSTMPPSSK